MQLSLFNWLLGTSPKKPETTAVRRQVRENASEPVVAEVNLMELWAELRVQWFPSRVDLDEYRVIWSSRAQKRTLASCNIRRRQVLVARELDRPDLRHWLRPLLYHEMCHAYLGMSVYSEHQRSRWHGAEFKALEQRHPEIPAFDAWVKHGGWAKAVRSDRARRAAQTRVRA